MSLLASHPSGALTYKLPSLLASWPYERRMNIHYKEVKTEADAAFAKLKAYSASAQKHHDASDFGQLRVGCDLHHLFFVFDEYSDQANSEQVRGMASCIMDTLRNKHGHDGECRLFEAATTFWEGMKKEASERLRRTFIASFQAYTDSVIRQAVDRDGDYTCTIPEYFDNRRYNIGVYPTIALLQLGTDLPVEASDHPQMKELEVCAADMVILANDVYSWNKEQSVGGDECNILTILMRRESLSLEETLLWVENRFTHLKAQFLAAKAALPSFGEEDQVVAQYVMGVGMWVTANECWSFECGRYFGTRGKEIQEHRVVELLPKVAHAPVLPEQL
ncbi:terpenoid synthase [Auricularia subglabra TFB-10046 SS5]|nr:terpenoid synthase [Auricularia subglabra TFB-10046 SS5]